jgi:hypothetical protein
MIGVNNVARQIIQEIKIRTTLTPEYKEKSL